MQLTGKQLKALAACCDSKRPPYDDIMLWYGGIYATNEFILVRYMPNDSDGRINGLTIRASIPKYLDDKTVYSLEPDCINFDGGRIDYWTKPKIERLPMDKLLDEVNTQGFSGFDPKFMKKAMRVFDAFGVDNIAYRIGSRVHVMQGETLDNATVTVAIAGKIL